MSLCFCIVTNAQQSTVDSANRTDLKLGTNSDGSDTSKVFEKVDEIAAFQGGAEAWRKYLQRNLATDVAQKQGLPKGGYTVIVEFVVNEDGNVTDVKPVAASKACTDCIKEAVRVIKNSPRWIPAMLNNSPVKYRHKQKFIFTVYDF